MLDQFAPSATTGASDSSSVPELAVSPNLKENTMIDHKNPSVLKVTLVGCGGTGINLTRDFYNDPRLFKALYIDTSMVNSRPGESVFTVGSGDGSGSNRKQNAREIEGEIPHISDGDLGIGDVAIIQASFAGGSGSVISPLLVREYHRRGVRVIVVGVSDASSAVGATNVLNTLKTYTSVCKNNEIYLPMILLSNDHASRLMADDAAKILVNDLIDILTRSVYEIDRNDRLNWINPTKAISVLPGIKMLSFDSEAQPRDPKAIVGGGSKEMVDSLLILQNSHEDDGKPLPASRLRKTGIYTKPHGRLVGKISSDIRAVDGIIDFVERTQSQDRAQRHQAIDRLSVSGDDDLIL